MKHFFSTAPCSRLLMRCALARRRRRRLPSACGRCAAVQTSSPCVPLWARRGFQARLPRRRHSLDRRRLSPLQPPPPPLHTRRSASSLFAQASAGPVGTAGDALVEGCEALSAELRELSAVQPATGSFFVRLFLGQVNVKVPSPADRETLRDEYNKFKDRTNVGIIFAGCVWGFTHAVLRHRLAYTGWVYSLTHLWLLYYYVSLALRENILRMVRRGGQSGWARRCEEGALAGGRARARCRRRRRRC